MLSASSCRLSNVFLQHIHPWSLIRRGDLFLLTSCEVSQKANGPGITSENLEDPRRSSLAMNCRLLRITAGRMNRFLWQQILQKPHQSKSHLLALGQAVKSQRIENDWADEQGLCGSFKPCCGLLVFQNETNLWIEFHYKLCENITWCLISVTLLNVEKLLQPTEGLWGKNCASVVK